MTDNGNGRNRDGFSIDDLLNDDFDEEMEEEAPTIQGRRHSTIHPDEVIGGDEGEEVDIRPMVTSIGGAVEGHTQAGTVASGLELENLKVMLMNELGELSLIHESMSMLMNIIMRNPQRLEGLSDEDILAIYDRLLSRQRNGQTFLARMIELSVKTKTIEDILIMGSGLEDKKTGKKHSPEVSARARKMTNLIRNELDRRVGINT